MINMVNMDRPCISTKYVMVYPWIYRDMKYHLMYIRGIYTWYIHGYSSLSKTRFRGLPVLLVSFNAHTCVVDQEYFIPRATMAIVPGEKAAHKRLNHTAANLEPSPSVAGGGCDGGGGGGLAGFPSLVAGNDLNLSE